MSNCAKPGCAGSATSVLSYDYASRLAILEDPTPEPISPHLYALCSPCAEKLQPPRGWDLEDNRSTPPLFLDRARPSIAREPDNAEDLEEELEESSVRQLFFGQSA